MFDSTAGDPLLMKSYVQQEMIRRGVLWGGFHNMCYSHSDADIEHTLSAYREVLPLLNTAVKSNTLAEVLRGDSVAAVFRKTSNFNTKPKRNGVSA